MFFCENRLHSHSQFEHFEKYICPLEPIVFVNLISYDSHCCVLFKKR